MMIEQMYTGCLAHAAYYIQSGNEAAIVDPLRDVNPYVEKARVNGAKIKYVLETHFHADFVSGHQPLHEKTGATIVYGPSAKPSFKAYVAGDNEELKLGSSTVKVIWTPGHTMESVCFLVSDETGKERFLFTGDTLFVDDVGRPDLAQKIDPTLTKEKLASTLYNSLHNKILPLADEIVIYPGHGAGSACGKHISPNTSDTLGHQKLANYGLRNDVDKEAFVKRLLDGLEEPPAYFPSNVLMNKGGSENQEFVVERGLKGWSPSNFERIANYSGAIVIDTRRPGDFRSGFIPNSISIGIDGNFAPWLGTLVRNNRQPILIVADPGKEGEVITRMARIGFDHCLGYLSGGIKAWMSAGKAIDKINTISAIDLQSVVKTANIIDVRKKEEYESEHLVRAMNIPLDEVDGKMNLIKPGKQYYAYCMTGYRSIMFCSILKSRGFLNVTDIQGGFNAVRELKCLPQINYLKRTLLL
jgi:glyoxylase-like metal-dependent hydrolase (beta-lactamase superfamily II)/rhodanese-related sulfurtransferase